MSGADIFQKDREDLQHFLRSLCFVDTTADPPDVIVACLTYEGINAMSQLTSLSNQEIIELTYNPDANDPTLERTIPRAHAKKIMMALAYHAVECHREHRIMEWTELTSEGFAQFRPTFDPHITYARFQPRPLPDHNNTAGAHRGLSQAETFKKGIKKDTRLFPVLKDEKEWNSYNRKLLAVARAQGVENILNPHYTPNTDEEIETFNAQNCYVWSAFVNTIETTKGLDLMRSHQATGNAHDFYAALAEHHQTSNSAKIEASSILGTLTQSDIAKDRRGMSRANYILKWSSLMKDYNEIVDEDSRISDMLAKTMLARTLSCDNDFNNINTQDSISQAQGNGILSYEDYKGIALDTAQNLDRREINTAHKSLSKLGINETQLLDQEDDEHEAQLEVNRTSRNSRYGPTVDRVHMERPRHTVEGGMEQYDEGRTGGGISLHPRVRPKQEW